MADGTAPQGDANTQDAVEYLALTTEAESTDRTKSQQDEKFSYGEQWELPDQQSRMLDERPALSINSTGAYCRKIVNAMREMRPRMKAHPTDGFATREVAKVVTGLLRHVEVNSNAEISYDVGCDQAVRGGWGYWRVRWDYVREDSFDKDMYIDPIYNRFSVYFDPNSVMLDGSDAERCLITDEIPRALFRKQFPGAAEMPFMEGAVGDASLAMWASKENIRIAEWFSVQRKKARLVRLMGQQGPLDLYEDELPNAETLRQMGLQLVGERESFKRAVHWQKQTGVEVLEQQDWPGRYIPVVPVYGPRAWIDGRMVKFSAVTDARDPQLMINFWNTAATECVAQSPKAKWIAAAGTLDGFESDYAKANTSAKPVLYYNLIDVEGKPAPAPVRVQPEGPPQGMLVLLASAENNLRGVMGMNDPEIRNPNFPKSGRAIRAEQIQTELSNFHFYDNLTASICHTGRIVLDTGRAAKVWEGQQVRRIIGDDGKPSLVTLNRQQAAIGKVLNDVTVGNYDVVMQTGPGTATRHEEGQEAMLAVLDTPLGEKIAATSDDIIMRNMDFQGADAIADRLAAANPLAQIDEDSDVPPAAQMRIKALEQQLEGATKAIQDLEADKKYRMSVEGLRQEGANKRTLMQETAETERTVLKGQAELVVENAENEAWMRDTMTEAVTRLSVAELNGFVKLLTTKQQGEISDRAAERQIAAKAEEAERDVRGVT